MDGDGYDSAPFTVLVVFTPVFASVSVFFVVAVAVVVDCPSTGSEAAAEVDDDDDDDDDNSIPLFFRCLFFMVQAEL